MLDDKTKYFINPSGRFVIGGPYADTGLTGRKIVVDSYQSFANVGGGAFSGKDPTKVDRSASYMLRHIAKNIVAAGIAKRIELQVSYAIGVSKPISLYANSFNTGIVSDEEIVNIINKVFNLTPQGIIDYLNLRRPIYKETSCYGHFGRRRDSFPWEELNKVEELKSYIK